LVAGLGFILPGLVVIILLSSLFLAGAPPAWVGGAGAGAGAAVAAVALQAGGALLRPGWERIAGAQRARWLAYVLAGAAATAVAGQWVVLTLLVCGFLELAWRLPPGRTRIAIGMHAWPLVAAAAGATGGLAALAWVAFKVGALAYGGGFVIIPLMQADAVGHYHWMTSTEFLNAVALGQVTPGPVVHTVAVVGYAAAGVGGALLAAVVAFAPSFSFVLIGADRFDRLRRNARVRAFLDGAGPAAIGAILGSAIPLARALREPWQFAVLAAAVVALLVLRRGVVVTLVAAGGIGALLGIAGGPLPG
jgi:chromate transporter